MSVKDFLSKAGGSFKRNLPAILTSFGIGGMITGTVLAAKATPKAMEAIRQKKQEEGHEELTVVQTIQAVWKFYLPAALCELGSAGCMIAALKEGNKRQAALMTAWNAAENGLREAQAYRQFVREKIGAKKEAEIYQEAVQQSVNQNPPPKDMNQELIDGVAPKPACYDTSFGRYYYVDYDTVAKAVNKLNNEINTGLNGYVSLNDFYTEINVSRIEYGDRLGWSTETGLIEIPEKDDLTYAGTPNGWPCWVLIFVNPPQYEYQFFRKH